MPELLFERFAKVAEEVSKSAVPRYVLEVGLIALTRVEPLEPIGALLQKLDALEARVEKGGGGSGGGTRAAATDDARAPAAHAPAAHVPAAHAPAAHAPAAHAPAAHAPAAPHAPVAAPAPKRAAPQSFTELIEAVTEVDPLLSDLAQSRLLARDSVHLCARLRQRVRRQPPARPLAAAARRAQEGHGRGARRRDHRRRRPTHVPATENLIEVEERKVDEDREQRRKEALEHPARKALDERFGGTWKDPIVDDVEKNQ